jgi:hypothetical protein
MEGLIAEAGHDVRRNGGDRSGRYPHDEKGET